MHVALINERTRQPIATTVEIAATRATGGAACSAATPSPNRSAMLLAPCAAVHTAGMRFPIDVVFVDRQGFAVKVVRNLQPWRIALATSGRAVIEMPAGTLKWGQVLLGDRLYLAPASETTRQAGADTAANAQPPLAFTAKPRPSAINPRRMVQRLRDSAGTSMLEAAMITPLLLLLTLSIVDFGAMFYIYLSLENGVSQATRFAVTGNVLADPTQSGREPVARRLDQAGDAPGDADADHPRCRVHIQPHGGRRRHVERRQRRAERARQGLGRLHLEIHQPDALAVFHRRPDHPQRRLGDEK